jgi:CRP-like cAMP-binding protein
MSSEPGTPEGYTQEQSVDVTKLPGVKPAQRVISYAQRVTDVLGQPDLFNQRARETAERLKVYPQYRGAYQFGTPGGADLDLRLCFTDLPSETDQERIRSQFQDLGVETDILFIAEKEIKDGKIADLIQFANAEQHLKYGFDPHYQQAAVGDTSLFSLYIFATMQPFQENSERPLLPAQEALDNLQITREGAIGWSHYYTGCFLGEYAQYKKDNLTDAAYQKRLAKFFSRVTLGSALAQLDQSQLDVLKPQLIEAIQSSDQTHSTDEKMTEVLLGNQQIQENLSEDSKQLLTLAGQIRSGQIKDVSKIFTSRAESMLFYNAYQQGIERRLEPGQDADYLTSYAFEQLVRNPELHAKLEVHPEGHVFFEQGETNNDLFYLMLGQPENKGVKVVVKKADGTTEEYVRSVGRTFGEISLFNRPRSATVSSQQDGTEVYALDAQIIRDLLASKTISEELKQRVLQTDSARTVDVLLQYFSREAGIFLQQTLPYTNYPEQETPERLMENNPFAQYYLGEAFHDIMTGFIQEGNESSPVKRISADQTNTLFEQGVKNDKIYVVTKGPATITLQNGETITHQKDAVFGESSMLGTTTTGSAALSEEAEVLAIDANWFQQFTQSRQSLTNVPDSVQGILPRHLLYHLAAIGYGRIQNRLTTQVHPSR